jgi:hypothetical protein
MLNRVNGKPLLHKRHRCKGPVSPLVAMRAASFLLHLRESQVLTYLVPEVARKVGMTTSQLDKAALVLAEMGKVDMVPTAHGVAVRLV